MIHSTGSHTKFYHRFHVVWTTKYRYKVMRGEMRERIREIIIQICQELGVHIETWRIVDRSRPHVHIGPASDSFVKGDDADQGTLVL